MLVLNLVLVLAVARPAMASGTAAGAAPEGPASAELSGAVARDGEVPVIVEYADAPTASPADGNSGQRERRAAQLRTNADRLLADLPAGSARDVRTVPSWPVLAATVDAAGLDALRRSPGVTRVAPNRWHDAALTDSVPLIGGPVAAAAGFDGSGRTVAVVDTGVDRNHPFLGGRVVAEACFSSTQAALGYQAVCPGPDPTTAIGPGSGAPCPAPGCDHGTHVAGIAAGHSDTRSGVAPGADIIAVQIFSRVTSSAVCGGPATCARYDDFSLVRALDYVYGLRGDHHIDAVNMSLGGLFFEGYCDFSAEERPFSDLRAAGIAPVVAAGNDSAKQALGYPACTSSAVSVGATDKSDAVASFSNGGPHLRLLAPGVSITSSIPGTGFGSKSGTSMATPHVVGGFAVARQQHPDWSVDAIESLLRATGLPVTDASNGRTTPRLRLDGAVRPPTYHGLDPYRVLDTRLNLGGTQGPVPAGSPIDVLVAGSLTQPAAGAVGVPATGVSAVAVNLTAVGPTAATHITAWPSGFPRPATSNLNLPAGDTRANLVVTRVGRDGRISLQSNSGLVDLVVDVVGWFDDGGIDDSGSRFTPITPKRLADTRTGAGVPAGAVGPGQTVDVDVAAACPTAGSDAASLNLTATNPTAATHLTVFPAGSELPLASTVNVDAGETAPNLAIARLPGSGRVSIRNNSGTTDVVVDLEGCFGPAADAAGTAAGAATPPDQSGRFVPVDPTRVVDSRIGQGMPDAGPLPAHSAYAVPVAGHAGVPLGARAVVTNVTAVNATHVTYLTAAPSDRPLTELVGALGTSVINAYPGQAVPNLVTSGLGPDGKFLLANSEGSVDVVVDVVGYLL